MTHNAIRRKALLLACSIVVGFPTMAATPTRRPEPIGVVTTFEAPLSLTNTNRLDISGAVGTDRVLSLQNAGFSIQSKAGIVQVAKPLKEFWAEQHQSKTDNFADPRIAYDPLAQRFLATSIRSGLSASSRALMFGFSTDQTGTTWQQAALVPQGECLWSFDYPMLGVSRDFVVVTVSVSQSAASPACLSSTNSPTQQLVIVFRRNELYGREVPPFTTIPVASPGVISPISSSLKDFSIGDGRLYLLQVQPSSHLAVSRITDQPLQSSAAVVLETVHTGITSPGPFHSGLTPLNTSKGESRLILCDTPTSGNVVGDQLFFAHSTRKPTAAVPTAGYNSVAWGQIDLPSGTLVQGGVLDTFDQNAYLCPSAAANRTGMVIGFTMANAEMHPSAAFVKRAAGDPLNYMKPPRIYRAGSAPYLVLSYPPNIEAGDYSITVEDPTDSCSFWTSQQIGKIGYTTSAWTNTSPCFETRL